MKPITDVTSQLTPQPKIKSVTAKPDEGNADTYSVIIESSDGTSHTVSLRCPNNDVAAAIKDAVNKMKVTTTPLHDLQMALEDLNTMLTSYRRNSGLPEIIIHKLSKTETYLDEGRDQLQLAATAPFPDFDHLKVMGIHKAAHVNNAVGSMMAAVIELSGVIASLAPGSLWMTVPVADEHMRLLESVNILCALWGKAFVLYLFR